MLLILEKQPVQYRAPLYAHMHGKAPDSIHVVYQQPGAVSATMDREFGSAFAWDIPLLEGYPYAVVEAAGGSLWKTLWRAISDVRTDAVLLTDFSSPISMVGLFHCLLIGKPLWLRMETQDRAYRRSAWKQVLRNGCYRLLYAPFSRALAIGVLNEQHYQHHGIAARKLHRVPYVVCNPLAALSIEARQQRRRALREQLGVSEETRVIAFCGKLIPKKDPGLLLDAYPHLPAAYRKRLHFLFIGSGALESALQAQSRSMSAPSTFTGFINQSRIHDYYLAADVLCLPSRQLGETWGLTVNEGLQAGCAILCSEHVGSAWEFGTWERVRVCRSEDAPHAAECLIDLLAFEPDLDWCSQCMDAQYSMQSAATGWLRALRQAGIGFRPCADSVV